MGEPDTEIEVRTLTGETITVSISSSGTIQELKLLLKQIFPPATTSSNFHLFLKGTKLSLQSQISSTLISHGEFIVLIPFTKKDKQKTLDPSENETNSQNFNQCSTSNFAESAWSDMMQDLSSLQEREIDGDESHSQVDLGNTKSTAQNEANKNLLDEAINELLNTLQSCDGDEPDEKSCEGFMQVLESVNCLSDPKTMNCMLKNANAFGFHGAADSSYSCICPLWLKVLMKAFYFLNIYCSFLQLQHRKVTLLSLEGGLKQLSKFGFGCEYSDLENLSVFCPQVIQFLDNDAECKRSNNAIVVIKSKSDLEYQIKGKPKRKMSTTRLVNAMRKREGAFRSDLWAAVKSFMEKKGKETIKSLSVSDLLLHVTEGNHKATKTDAKRTRKSISEPANSFSPEVQCNETNPLLPTEMVEHLKAGLGSQGQMGGVGSMCGSITAPIQRRQKLLSVVFLVVFPYLKSKLHSIYNKEREAAVQASLWGNVNERFGEIGDVGSSFGNISQPGYVSNMTQGQTQTFRDGFSVGGMSQVHFDLMDKGTDAVGGKLLVTMDICRAFDQIYKEHLDGMCL